MTHIRVAQRTVNGEPTWGRELFEGKDKNYDLCLMGCAYNQGMPEGCQIKIQRDKLERVFHCRFVTWECPQYTPAPKESQ